MNVGFTYDLKDDYLLEGYSKDQVAEFDSKVTIDAVCAAIEGMGHKVDRIGHAFALSKLLIKGQRWDLVFNICEGMYGSGRESLVPALLDAGRIPYVFSGPLVHAITLNKAVTKKLLSHSGLPVTDFMLAADAADIKKPKWKWPYFVKAVAEGTGKSVTPASKVFNMTELRTQAQALIEEFKQPVIIEPFLPGREVTVGVLGSGADAFSIGVMEVAFTDKADSDIHSYYNKENCETAAIYTLAEDDFAARCAEIAVEAYRALDIKDACRVDIRADGRGRPQIMEINSLPGLMPGRSDLILLAELAGLSYEYVIETIVNSAVKRWAL